MRGGGQRSNWVMAETGGALNVAMPERMVQAEEGDDPWLPCLHLSGAPGYEFGLAVGKRFGRMIRSRFASDPALHSEMLPFAATQDGQKHVAALTAANKCVFLILALFSPFICPWFAESLQHQLKH